MSTAGSRGCGTRRLGIAALLAMPGCVESAWAQSRARDAGTRDGAAAAAAGTARHRERVAREGMFGAMGVLRPLDLDDGARAALEAQAPALREILAGGAQDAGANREPGQGGGGATGEASRDGGTVGSLERGSAGSGFGAVGAASGTLRRAPIVLEGAGLPADVVRRVILRGSLDLRACFLITGASSDAGTIAADAQQAQVRFVIKPDGTVSALPADLTVTGARAEVARCLAERFRALVFPAPSDGARVRATQLFRYTPPGMQ